MRLGVMLPLSDIGGEPQVVRDFALAAEEMGYTNLGLADHVLGVNAASRPDWGDRNTSADLFHDPFVCFGFLAGLCRPTTEFSTQVLILAQRQAVLVAKQAASLDLLCGGRFRLGLVLRLAAHLGGPAQQGELAVHEAHELHKVGLHALDLVPKKAAGTAAGFTGFFGYVFGSALSGTGVGWIADHWGWSGVFITMVGCCLLAIAFSALTLGHRAHSAARAEGDLQAPER